MNIKRSDKKARKNKKWENTKVNEESKSKQIEKQVGAKAKLLTCESRWIPVFLGVSVK